ncbi:rho GTPase-activating protein 32 isoform X2 [Gouania willdenowi]|uniref:rho GTPase-activating protein 32 isoform X2 n=1 Tax=Gouania willdenowi TaxID=441366 RepID=UPI0010541228|nr:rho GTPase-activating protein 32-like isoform X2 [Gouania willdenowi]
MEAGCTVAAVIENAASGPQGEPGSGDVLEGDTKTPADQDKNDGQDSDGNPAEEPKPQETITAMARGDDITEPPAEHLLRSCVSTASMKVKNMKKLTFSRGHFPRLAECAHFHYETVDFGNVQLTFAEEQSEALKAGLDSKELIFLVQVTCQSRNWLVRRSYEDFRVLDKHLHLCIYDRRYSQLTELPRYNTLKDNTESVATMLANYLSRFSAIADNKINCGPVLTWMEIDNKGNHLLVTEESSINVPAIAAAHVTKRYIAQATDELTFEVGDIVSVIDMPPKEDTGWWRGKHGFQVGFFPCDCVELINDKIPPSVQSSVPKPVCKKHGKLVTFLRSFMKSRPPPQKLRQRGILRERVFGCDLGEHLHNSGHEVPQVVKSCAEFIEKHGVVDGIYRLSGISSNIQKLRHEFDSEQIPELGRDVFRQDIHSVGSLCKLYFRELPNPLLTYQLYDRFSDAVSAATDEERLVKIHNVIQQLPPPHYRTLEFLMRHLSRLATFSSSTSMHTKNLAIVWAPNLLRSKQIESACFSGTAAFMEVRIQSVVVEFILNNTEALFSAKLNAIIRESTGNNTLSRPKSLMICSPSTKLLSLEEAQARTQAQLSSPATTPGYSQSDYIEVGEGPGALQGKFHTVIELPMESVKRPPAKAKKSPVGNWFSFFHLSKSNSMSKRKLKRHPSEPNEIKSIALPGGRGDSGTLRSTKSEESLTSLHNLGGENPSYHPVRPRSTSEAVSAVSRADVQSSRTKEGYTTPLSNAPNGVDRVRSPPCVSPQHQEDDLDLSPPAAGISTLDFDPMSFQCSPTSATPGPQRSKDANKWRKNAGCSSESDPISSPNNISCFQSPEISPVVDESGKVTTSNQMSPQRRKQFKTQADVQSAFDALPSPLADKYEGSVTDGKVLRASNARGNTQTGSQASAVTDISPSAQNLPDPGTDRLMSSVSVLPPHPPSMSAARKLALALAESAQKASSASRRRDNIQPHPLQRHQASPGPGRLHRPSHLDLEVYPQEYCGVETHFYHQSDHFPQSHLCPEPSQVTDGQDSPCNFTPNVSPLGSGSFDEGSAERREEQTYESVGVSMPALSPPTSPIYANDSLNVYNFRAFLAETNMPASIEELIPRPSPSSSAQQHSPVEDGLLEEFSKHPRYPHHHWPSHAGRTSAPHCPRPSALPHHVRGLHRQSSEGRHSPLAVRQPLSPQYRRYHRDDQPFSGVRRQQLQWQRSGERGVGQPAIRRARSFHAPQISHYDFVRTEVVHPDGMFYIEPRPDATYQRFVPSNVHPERYDCLSNPYPDPCPQTSVKHSQASIRSTRDRGQMDYYNYSPQRLPPPPVNRELYIEGTGTVVYEARDSEAFERVFYQPVRHKNTYLIGSPGDSPVSPMETKNRDIVHTRSKSDPGNACLLSADKAQSHSVPVASPTSPKSLHIDFDVTRQFVHRSGVESNASRQMRMKQSLSQQPKLRKVPSLPERGCSNIEHNERSHTRCHDQDRMMPSNFSVIGKPGILRKPGRSQSTRENRDYYYHHVKSPLDPEHLGAFSTQPNRRTQSTKVRPTQSNHMEEYYAAHRAKPTRSSKAAVGYLPGQGCMSPRGHRLLSKALGQEAFYNAALRSEAGVLE